MSWPPGTPGMAANPAPGLSSAAAATETPMMAMSTGKLLRMSILPNRFEYLTRYHLRAPPDRCLLQRPVTLTGLRLKVRPIPHRDSDGMKCSRLASLRFEAENVLTMYLFTHQLNGLFQRIFL